jgi:hypothetical protein
MMDDDAVHTALRTYAFPVTIATTGPIELAATATGYTRADGGSFYSDMFRRGMEIVTSGFGAPVRAIITSVSATDMRVRPFVISVSGGAQTVTYPALVASPAASGRSIVAPFPSMRELENEAPSGLTAFVPISGIPYVEEEFSPGVTMRVAGNLYSSNGDYFWKYHGVAGVGSSHLRKSLFALKQHYTDAIIPIPNEQYVIRIRGDPAPTQQNVIQTVAGPVLILAISWEVRART